MVNMTTNYAKAKYQEIYDVNTVADSVSVIGIHTPVGNKPREMLAGFFTQFRKYKYAGCSVVATPAARLPLDVMNIALESGQNGASPKDVFNPILVRGCHGDNLNAALNSIYKGSFQNEGSTLGKDDFGNSVVPSGSLTWEQMYYRMLQDPSFKKFSLSSGIKISGLHPMIYNVASNHQILPNQYQGGVGALTPDDDGALNIDSTTMGAVATGAAAPNDAKKIYPQLMTNRLQSLGWMDTKQVLNSQYGEVGTNGPVYTALPKIFMAAIVMPPAYRVSTAMRFVVTHFFEFKEFNTSLTLEGASEYYDWLSQLVPSSKANDTFDVVNEKDNVEAVSDGVF